MSIEESQKIGKQLANEVLDSRRDRLTSRVSLLTNSGPIGVGARTSGYLIAEGDSWFDYPFYDVLNNLEDFHGFDVESIATKSDTMEAMAYNSGQLDKFVRRLEKMIHRGEIPKAILLSGGGNDIAGEELKFLLNHAISPAAGLNEKIVDGFLNERVRDAYVTIIQSVTEVSERLLNTKVPIVLHGYGYAIPDGRGYLGGWGLLPGPWLEPGFKEKGFDNVFTNSGIIAKLIDKLNDMLLQLTTVSGFTHLHYLNLRPYLNSDPNGPYKDDWGNELHPTESGFQKVADQFAYLINKL